MCAYTQSYPQSKKYNSTEYPKLQTSLQGKVQALMGGINSYERKDQGYRQDEVGRKQDRYPGQILDKHGADIRGLVFIFSPLNDGSSDASCVAGMFYVNDSQ